MTKIKTESLGINELGWEVMEEITTLDNEERVVFKRIYLKNHPDYDTNYNLAIYCIDNDYVFENNYIPALASKGEEHIFVPYWFARKYFTNSFTKEDYSKIKNVEHMNIFFEKINRIEFLEDAALEEEISLPMITALKLNKKLTEKEIDKIIDFFTYNPNEEKIDKKDLIKVAIDVFSNSTHSDTDDVLNLENENKIYYKTLSYKLYNFDKIFKKGERVEVLPQYYLHMVNPSTNEIHIEPVKHDCNSILKALNFRFGRDYNTPIFLLFGA
jgi:hypothetical protein